MKLKSTITLKRIASLALISQSFFTLANTTATKADEKAADPKKIEKAAETKKAKNVGKTVSEILGGQVAKQIQSIFTEKKGEMAFDRTQFLKGLNAELDGKKSVLSDEDKQSAMEAFQKYQMEKHKKEAEKYKAENEKYITENKKKKGVKTTPSGLQYKVIKSGPAKGKSPKEDWEVSVHYKGKLTNGNQFDASFEGKEPKKDEEPMSFQVGGVIRGWSEALQMMKPGDVWELTIPSDLGYGPRPFPEIPAFSTLIFEVRLLEAKEPAPVIEAASEAPAVEAPSAPAK